MNEHLHVFMRFKRILDYLAAILNTCISIWPRVASDLFG